MRVTSYRFPTPLPNIEDLDEQGRATWRCRDFCTITHVREGTFDLKPGDHFEVTWNGPWANLAFVRDLAALETSGQLERVSTLEALDKFITDV